ncbi:unnamed protein product [Rhizophagus irregularis]|nr:unnamed protein product [Rhizophagus irregularis]
MNRTFERDGRRLLRIRRTVLYRQISVLRLWTSTLTSRTSVGFLDVGVFFCLNELVLNFPNSGRYDRVKELKNRFPNGPNKKSTITTAFTTTTILD